MFAYVGSRTTRERNARGDGISVFRLESESGALDKIQVLGDLVNPSYLTLSPNGRFLYTVHGDLSEVSAFAVDRESGRLSMINRQSTDGKNPVHLAFDPSGQYLVVTNHIGASLAVLPIAADGSLQALTQLVKISGPIGPHRVEQQQAKPHFNLFDPTGRFVIVPDKGLDRVFCFRFVDGRLEPAARPYVHAREGSGPRHAVFNPRLPVAYVVNELDSTVTSYRFESNSGGMEPIQIQSTLPDTFTGNSRAAAIMIDSSGRNVYASNRGHDSIACFRVDAASGMLTFAGADSTGGRTPRFFALSPDQRRVYALNEDSDSVAMLDVDPSTGRLRTSGTAVAAGSPVCMIFGKG